MPWERRLDGLLSARAFLVGAANKNPDDFSPGFVVGQGYRG